MHEIALDAADIKLIQHLQSNARASNAELAEIALLSPSQCHRRVRRLETLGVIKGYTAEIDAAAVGLDISAFVHVSLGSHGGNPAQAFVEAIADIPEIMECYSLTGDTDYLLRVVMPSLAAFSDFLMHRLIALPFIGSVKSYIVLEEVRRLRALPLGRPAGGG
jgi:Lrp/AsnC family transcriptional regulator, leucine-responsive regulatory protein